MKYLLLFTLIFNDAKAQFITKNDAIVYSLSFIAGTANGVEEAIKFHYNTGFAFVHPHASRQFWDPRISWTNKNNSAISKLVPFFSDGYHLTRGISRITATLAIALNYSDFKKKLVFKQIAKKFILSMLANRIGQYLTYDIIYKNRE